MHRFLGCSTRLLILSVFCFGLASFNPDHVFAAEQSSAEQGSESVDSLMAGLSDEQVRQMLIEELQDEATATQEHGLQRMKGPAYVLSRMLRGLSSEHKENEDQLTALFAGIPNVLPDLYKVFLTL